ncbi:NYN domain-containing protein [Pasteurella sp. P03HT]
MKKTAVLIDGGFFFARVGYFYRKHFSTKELTSDHLIDLLWKLVKFHIEKKHGQHIEREPLELYRIYYYDSPPLDKQVKYPLCENGEKTPRNKNFKDDPMYKLRLEFHQKLKETRKTALRMGTTQDNDWQIKGHTLKELRKGIKKWEDLTNDDWFYQITQKSVDVKLGMDITILSYEKLVDVIVLVAGDADFVPAAKQARIKGIDFILNPLHQTTSPKLAEHVDGIQSFSFGVALAEILKCCPEGNPTWWEEYKTRPKGTKIQEKGTSRRKSFRRKS